jgi:hypothetical protein
MLTGSPGTHAALAALVSKGRSPPGVFVTVRIRSGQRTKSISCDEENPHDVGAVRLDSRARLVPRDERRDQERECGRMHVRRHVRAKVVGRRVE